MGLTQHRITFQQKQTFIVPAGTRLDNAAAQAGYALRTHCGGAGICGKCQVIANHQKVLACQAIVESDLDIIIPDSSLRDNEQNVFVQTASKSAVCRLPSAVSTGYGIALDIGTTTLAAELHDFTGTLSMQIASCANPQRQFGDDIIARIQKVMEDETALTAMQRMIVEAINEMIAELIDKRGITSQDISVMVAAGNTVMQSLLFGIDPSSLGVSPFHAPVNNFPPRQAGEIDLAMSGTVEAFPIFGGFVGGDIVAGMLAIKNSYPKSRGCSAAQSPDCLPSFFLDIGTNGEIVLAYRERLFTAATAAGPAFEGARIEHGTLAVPGAIEHVDYVDGKIVVSTIAGKPPIGICGSGLIDAVAVLLDQEIILPSGRFADKASHFELVSAAASGIGEAIVLTQRDIRELQLASGAIKAGITLLLREHHLLPEEIETFYVAGGFGQSIRLASARRIGLLPSIPSERFQFCGNTSLAGARAMLLKPDNAEVVRQLIEQSQHCELANLPQFQEVFAESMRWDDTAEYQQNVL